MTCRVFPKPMLIGETGAKQAQPGEQVQASRRRAFEIWAQNGREAGDILDVGRLAKLIEDGLQVFPGEDFQPLATGVEVRQARAGGVADGETSRASASPRGRRSS